jgi:TRAP-type mannitol/chloroaromatic compound transport system permease small subunit
MTRILHFIDSLSAWAGKSFAWCIVILTFSTCYEVFVRYVLGEGLEKKQDNLAEEVAKMTGGN